jgi:DNA ligase 1
MPPLITVKYHRALYLPEADLWLDPQHRVDRAFISHAHSDHVGRHRVTFASELTLQLMRLRYDWKDRGDERALPMAEPVLCDGWELRLLPAGHIVGSAMLHLTRVSDGATLLYTGDYKLRQGLSTPPCELRPADTLIMESTFGHPRFVFPPMEETVSAVQAFVREALAANQIPVLLGYSLGKAQEILRALVGMDVPVMVHSSVLKMTEGVKHALGALPEYCAFDAAQAAGYVLVFPPNLARSPQLQRLPNRRTAMLTGWALHSSAKYRYGVDAVFPLSDHADYPELIETVERVRPRHVRVVHGYTRDFAADLRRRGYDARTFDPAEQLELSL